MKRRRLTSPAASWALALPDWSGAVVAAALGLLLLSGAVFASLRVREVQQTSEDVRTTSLLNQQFQAAKFAVAQEESLERKYRLEPAPEYRAAHHQAGQNLLASLASVKRLGDSGDRASIEQVETLHRSYLTATARMFDAVDAGNTALVNQIDSNEVDPSFGQIEDIVSREADEHQAETATQLARLQAEDSVLARAPFVIVIGLALVVLLAVILDAHRRARDAKSTFLARMSHELRTPLNSVLGFAQLLRIDPRSELTEKQARYVANIETGGRHLLALINDILDLSRVEAGKLEVSTGGVEVRPLLARALADVTPIADSSGIELVPLSAPAGLYVAADPQRLLQVVLNGLSNALKFTPRGGRVAVTARAEAHSVVIEISDTGTGIPAAQLARVFDEFEQGSSARNRSHEGAGLGLPLSRRLTELMGGSLTLRSEEGSGTTFVVILRRLPAPALEPARVPVSEEAAAN